MKKITLFSLLASISLLAFTFKAADDKFTVDTEKSSIQWLAKKIGGQHDGTVKLREGSLTFAGNTLKGGSFTMDMTSIALSEPSQRLLDHLRSDDFFSVAKNSASTFVVTKVAAAGKDQVNITGNLTIKGITNAVTFPATIKKQGSIVAAVAKGIRIDRTKFDIKFRSASFFSSIGNQAIEDEFELSINLVAKK